MVSFVYSVLERLSQSGSGTTRRVALRSPAVAEAFARKGVVYLKADWTNRSAEIASVLGSFGRSGVPLYVVYPARVGQTAPPEPQVLPQILGEGTILEAID